MNKNLLSFAFVGFTFLTPFEATPTVSFDAVLEIFAPKPLAQKTMDLTNRYPDQWVNEIFADNMLLTLHYLKENLETLQMRQMGQMGQMVFDWEKIRQPFAVEFTLKPGQIFAFHDNLLPEFKDRVVRTTGAHFNWDDGFKSDGWLIGDGVCHLATLMNWVSSEAGLKVVALAKHDFLPVPGVPREFGTSIMWTPDGSRNSQSQNLYIENTFDFPVKFTFKAASANVEITVSK